MKLRGALLCVLAKSIWWCLCESVFKKRQNTAQQREECEEQPCSHRGQRRRRGGGAPGAGAEIPLKPLERTTPEQTSTPQPVEDHTVERVDMLGRSCCLRRARTGAGSAQGTHPCWSMRREEQQGGAIRV